MTGRRAVLAGAAAALALTGCHARLAADHRLKVTDPPDAAHVKGQVLVRWRAAPSFRAVRFDGSRSPDRGEFALFVDRPPVAPGAHIESVADGDPGCRALPSCPDRSWLAAHGVYLTTLTHLLVPALPASGGRPAGDGLRRHHIVVVLLDGTGRRIGDTAAGVTVYSGR